MGNMYASLELMFSVGITSRLSREPYQTHTDAMTIIAA